MSTKIYNGYMIGNCSLAELHIFVMKARQILDNVRENMYQKLVINWITNKIDRLTLNLLDEQKIIEEEGCCLQTLARNYIIKQIKEIKQTGGRDSEYDIDYNFSIIPIKDKILILIYFEREEFIEAWEGMEEVNDYPYWNNTDPPEELSDELWNKREKDWEEALPGVIAPVERAFNIDAQNAIYLSLYKKEDQESAVSKAKTLDQRAKFWAKEILRDEYFKEHHYFDTIAEEKSISKWIKMANAFMEDIEGELKYRFEEKIKLVKSKLKSEITVEDLGKYTKDFKTNES